MSTTNHNLGILCAVLGMIAMSLMDVIIKWLSPSYPLHEIVFVRTVIALVLTVFLVHMEGGLGTLRTKRPWLHTVRGFMVVVANLAFYLALATMTIAEATALFHIAPLIITGLSGPVLGESVGWRRWLAIIVGFVGVLLITKIGTDAFSTVALFPIIAAITYAITQLMTRRLGATESASVMSFYISVVFLIISVGFWVLFGDGRLASGGGDELNFLFRAWVMPDWNSLWLMLACGVLVAIVGYMLNQAYRISEANVIAPYEFIILPMAIFWGVVLWDEQLGLQTISGIVMIAVSGLYVFMRERAQAARRDENASTV